MPRALLLYEGGAIELPTGDTVVGRGVECRLRFNDSSVSRRHLRFRVGADTIVVEDLGSSNGTRVNGEIIETPHALADRDEIELGNRALVLNIEHGERGSATDDVETRRQEVERSARSLEVNCSSCRALIPASAERCPHCDEPATKGRWHAKTQIFDPKDLEAAERERRLGQRYETSTPVLYSSENLTIDAEAHNLSLSGVFVATDLFDDKGSECRVTLLPDGGSPVHLVGVVRRVVLGQEDDSPPGMGIEFTSIPPNTEKWLLAYLQRQRQRG